MVAGQRVSYGDSSLQYVKVYPGSSNRSEPTPLLIFLHGGAWTSGSTTDHQDLAEYISTNADVAVALIEYRLSVGNNGVYHPDHLNDVYRALHLLFSQRTSSQFHYDLGKIVFTGHSAGGYMVNAAALASDQGQDSFPAGPIRNMPALDARIRKGIKAFVAVASIYSIAGLLKEYPSYDYFVKPAFYPPGSHASAPYQALEKAGVEAWPVAAPGSYARGNQPRMYIIHSSKDSLLSSQYNSQGVGYLRQKGLDPVVDLTSFKGDHDELLHTRAFWQRLINITHDETG